MYRQTDTVYSTDNNHAMKQTFKYKHYGKTDLKRHKNVIHWCEYTMFIGAVLQTRNYCFIIILKMQ